MPQASDLEPSFLTNNMGLLASGTILRYKHTIMSTLVELAEKKAQAWPIRTILGKDNLKRLEVSFF